jgi:hypothetical protein
MPHMWTALPAPTVANEAPRGFAFNHAISSAASFAGRPTLPASQRRETGSRATGSKSFSTSCWAGESAGVPTWLVQLPSTTV